MVKKRFGCFVVVYGVVIAKIKEVLDLKSAEKLWVVNFIKKMVMKITILRFKNSFIF